MFHISSGKLKFEVAYIKFQLIQMVKYSIRKDNISFWLLRES